MEKEWFKHEYHTRNKQKLAALIYEEKSRGYGLFWIIVEMLYESRAKAMELDEATYISIVQQSGEPLEYVKDFVDRCLERWKVFKRTKKKMFTTEKVEQNTKHREEISVERRLAALKSAESRRLKAANAQQNLASAQQDETFAKQNPADKRREEKKREEENREDKKVRKKGSIVGTSADDSASDRELRGKYTELAKSFSTFNPTEIWLAVKGFIEEHRPKFFEPYLDAWNLFAIKYKIIQEAQRFTDKRNNKFRIRITEPAFDFFKILEAIRNSQFLRGENNTQWRVSIEYILESEENYTKILEGKYK